MTIHNAEIAQIFNEMADLLEIKGENPFRVRAYRTAALTINDLSKNLSELIKEDADLTELPGIGDAIDKKIKIIIKTGKLPELQALEKHTPHALSDMMKIAGLGPKRIQLLYKKLNIKSMKDLQHAIDSGKIKKLQGFGEKLQQQIKDGIKHLAEYTQRIKLANAIPIAQSLLIYLQKFKGNKEIIIAGSYRRRKETIGDLDILITTNKKKEIIDYFIKYDEVAKIISQGTTRSSVHLRSGIQVDLRVVPQISYGAALFYLTGSKAHNIAIRKIAVKKNLKINEYGVFKKQKRIASKTETEIYKRMGLPYIEPELRENRGEIQAAQKNKLPRLITLKDIRGDLHCHTHATDGANSLEEMANAAIKLGYEYLSITDHTKHLTVAHGLNDKQVLQQIKMIDKLNEKFKNFVILKSMEIDILEDGSLDLSDEVLKELDLTVCSVHSKFGLSEKKQTERIIRAMDSPYFNILGHATGRLINRRQPYQVDLAKVMAAAKERGCILEINAQPDRLDIDDVHCKIAKEMKLKFAISTDSHHISQLENMQFGIYQARRGWIEASDVLNTRKLNLMLKLLKRK